MEEFKKIQKNDLQKVLAGEKPCILHLYSEPVRNEFNFISLPIFITMNQAIYNNDLYGTKDYPGLGSGFIVKHLTILDIIRNQTVYYNDYTVSIIDKGIYSMTPAKTIRVKIIPIEDIDRYLDEHITDYLILNKVKYDESFKLLLELNEVHDTRAVERIEEHFLVPDDIAASSGKPYSLFFRFKNC